MKSRAVLASLFLGAALVLSSAQNANACFGLFGGCGGCCEPSCCEPTCGCEPSCCAAEPTCGCEMDCCDPCCAPRCGLLSKFKGMFKRHRGCGCCEPTCCAPEPTCCAPEPTCCAEPTCCDPCCAPRCGLLSKFKGMFRNRGCGCCEPTCGCEPSCGCH